MPIPGKAFANGAKARGLAVIAAEAGTDTHHWQFDNETHWPEGQRFFSATRLHVITDASLRFYSFYVVVLPIDDCRKSSNFAMLDRTSFALLGGVSLPKSP